MGEELKQLEFDFMGGQKFTQADLTREIEKMHSDEKSLLCAKGKEYATDTDRLENFKEIAELLRIDMKLVCGVFLLKHTLAILKYVFKGKVPATESVREKILDARNYLLFLEIILNLKQEIKPNGEKQI